MRRTPPRQRSFNALKDLLYRWAPPMDVAINEPQHYVLNTRFIQKNGKPLLFGSVRITKTYVSFHFKPIYVNPGLLEPLSPALRKRQQGKNCFNFDYPDKALFAELEGLVKAGYEDFVRRKIIWSDEHELLLAL